MKHLIKSRDWLLLSYTWATSVLYNDVQVIYYILILFNNCTHLICEPTRLAWPDDIRLYQHIYQANSDKCVESHCPPHPHPPFLIRLAWTVWPTFWFRVPQVDLRITSALAVRFNQKLKCRQHLQKLLTENHTVCVNIYFRIVVMSWDT